MPGVGGVHPLTGESEALPDFASQVLHGVFERFRQVAASRLDEVARPIVNVLITQYLGPAADHDFDKTLEALGVVATAYGPTVVLEFLLEWRGEAAAASDLFDGDIASPDEALDPSNASGISLAQDRMHRRRTAMSYVYYRAVLALLAAAAPLRQTSLGTPQTGGGGGEGASSPRREMLGGVASAAAAGTDAVRALLDLTLGALHCTGVPLASGPADPGQQDQAAVQELMALVLARLSEARFEDLAQRVLSVARPSAPLLDGLRFVRLPLGNMEAITAANGFLLRLKSLHTELAASKATSPCAATEAARDALVGSVAAILAQLPAKIDRGSMLLHETGLAPALSAWWSLVSPLLQPRRSALLPLLPLAVQVCVVSPIDALAARWTPLFDAAVALLRNRHSAALAMGCIAQLVWAHLFRAARGLDGAALRASISAIAKAVFADGCCVWTPAAVLAPGDAAAGGSALDALSPATYRGLLLPPAVTMLVAMATLQLEHVLSAIVVGQLLAPTAPPTHRLIGLLTVHALGVRGAAAAAAPLYPAGPGADALLAAFAPCTDSPPPAAEPPTAYRTLPLDYTALGVLLTADAGALLPAVAGTLTAPVDLARFEELHGAGDALVGDPMESGGCGMDGGDPVRPGMDADLRTGLAQAMLLVVPLVEARCAAFAKATERGASPLTAVSVLLTLHADDRLQAVARLVLSERVRASPLLRPALLRAMLALVAGIPDSFDHRRVAAVALLNAALREWLVLCGTESMGEAAAATDTFLDSLAGGSGGSAAPGHSAPATTTTAAGVVLDLYDLHESYKRIPFVRAEVLGLALLCAPNPKSRDQALDLLATVRALHQTLFSNFGELLDGEDAAALGTAASQLRVMDVVDELRAREKGFAFPRRAPSTGATMLQAGSAGGRGDASFSLIGAASSFAGGVGVSVATATHVPGHAGAAGPPEATDQDAWSEVLAQLAAGVLAHSPRLASELWDEVLLRLPPLLAHLHGAAEVVGAATATAAAVLGASWMGCAGTPGAAAYSLLAANTMHAGAAGVLAGSADAARAGLWRNYLLVLAKTAQCVPHSADDEDAAMDSPAREHSAGTSPCTPVRHAASASASAPEPAGSMLLSPIRLPGAAPGTVVYAAAPRGLRDVLSLALGFVDSASVAVRVGTVAALAHTHIAALPLMFQLLDQYQGIWAELAQETPSPAAAAASPRLRLLAHVAQIYTQLAAHISPELLATPSFRRQSAQLAAFAVAVTGVLRALPNAFSWDLQSLRISLCRILAFVAELERFFPVGLETRFRERAFKDAAAWTGFGRQYEAFVSALSPQMLAATEALPLGSQAVFRANLDRQLADLADAAVRMQAALLHGPVFGADQVGPRGSVTAWVAQGLASELEAVSQAAESGLAALLHRNLLEEAVWRAAVREAHSPVPTIAAAYFGALVHTLEAHIEHVAGTCGGDLSSLLPVFDVAALLVLGLVKIADVAKSVRRLGASLLRLLSSAYYGYDVLAAVDFDPARAVGVLPSDHGAAVGALSTALAERHPELTFGAVHAGLERLELAREPAHHRAIAAMLCPWLGGGATARPLLETARTAEGAYSIIDHLVHISLITPDAILIDELWGAVFSAPANAAFVVTTLLAMTATQVHPNFVRAAQAVVCHAARAAADVVVSILVAEVDLFRTPRADANDSSDGDAPDLRSLTERATAALELLAEVVVIAPAAVSAADLTALLHVCVVCGDHQGPRIMPAALRLLTNLTYAGVANPRRYAVDASERARREQAMDLVELLSGLEARGAPLWAHEDISLSRHSLVSAAELSKLVGALVEVFALGGGAVSDWAALALRWAATGAGRHVANRSLQVYRALGAEVLPGHSTQLVRMLAGYADSRLTVELSCVIEAVHSLRAVVAAAAEQGCCEVAAADAFWAGAALLHSSTPAVFVGVLDLLETVTAQLRLAPETMVPLVLAAAPAWAAGALESQPACAAVAAAGMVSGSAEAGAVDTVSSEPLSEGDASDSGAAATRAQLEAQQALWAALDGGELSAVESAGSGFGGNGSGFGGDDDTGFEAASGLDFAAADLGRLSPIAAGDAASPDCSLSGLDDGENLPPIAGFAGTLPGHSVAAVAVATSPRPLTPATVAQAKAAAAMVAATAPKAAAWAGAAATGDLRPVLGELPGLALGAQQQQQPPPPLFAGLHPLLLRGTDAASVPVARRVLSLVTTLAELLCGPAPRLLSPAPDAVRLELTLAALPVLILDFSDSASETNAHVELAARLAQWWARPALAPAPRYPASPASGGFSSAAGSVDDHNSSFAPSPSPVRGALRPDAAADGGDASLLVGVLESFVGAEYQTLAQFLDAFWSALFEALGGDTARVNGALTLTMHWCEAGVPEYTSALLLAIGRLVAPLVRGQVVRVFNAASWSIIEPALRSLPWVQQAGSLSVLASLLTLVHEQSDPTTQRRLLRSLLRTASKTGVAAPTTPVAATSATRADALSTAAAVESAVLSFAYPPATRVADMLRALAAAADTDGAAPVPVRQLAVSSLYLSGDDAEAAAYPSDSEERGGNDGGSRGSDGGTLAAVAGSAIRGIREAALEFATGRASHSPVDDRIALVLSASALGPEPPLPLNPDSFLEGVSVSVSPDRSGMLPGGGSGLGGGALEVSAIGADSDADSASSLFDSDDERRPSAVLRNGAIVSSPVKGARGAAVVAAAAGLQDSMSVRSSAGELSVSSIGGPAELGSAPPVPESPELEVLQPHPALRAWGRALRSRRTVVADSAESVFGLFARAGAVVAALDHEFRGTARLAAERVTDPRATRWLGIIAVSQSLFQNSLYELPIGVDAAERAAALGGFQALAAEDPNYRLRFIAGRAARAEAFNVHAEQAWALRLESQRLAGLLEEVEAMGPGPGSDAAVQHLGRRVCLALGHEQSALLQLLQRGVELQALAEEIAVRADGGACDDDVDGAEPSVVALQTNKVREILERNQRLVEMMSREIDV